MEIARVDIRGVVPGGPGWDAAHAAVTASMVAHGCVLVAHDALSADLRRALPELFALPLEVKQRTVSTTGSFRGYIGQRPGMHWESLRVGEPVDAANVREFADILWPEGNPQFCDKIVSLAKNMLKLEEMVETLVLEESVAAHFGMVVHNMRISHNGAPPDMKTSMSMLAQYDDSMITVIVQHEVHVGDGRRLALPPEPDTFAFVAGEQLRVVTNGRVLTCFHSVA